MHNIEIWLVIDADGDYAVGADKDEAVERYEDAFGSATGARLIKLNVRATLPQPVEVDVVVPDEAGELVQATAE